MKKIISLIVFLAIITVVITGCQNTGEVSNPVNIVNEQENEKEIKNSQPEVSMMETDTSNWVVGEKDFKLPPESERIRGKKEDGEERYYMYHYKYNGHDYTIVGNDANSGRTIFSGTLNSFDEMTVENREMIVSKKYRVETRQLLAELEASKKTANSMDKKYGRK